MRRSLSSSYSLSSCRFAARHPALPRTRTNDAPELEAIGENERRVDSIRVRAGRYVAAPPTAGEVELLEQPRKPKKPGKKKKVAAPR